ncbi:MAG TPA: ribonuclease Z, partial [bacterium]|nr:ribonuclease Z [bacterium]
FASATALEYEGEVLLFDCGEGTQLQLMRSPLHWGRLSTIFIGHLHGDHLYGLPGLLGTMSLSEREDPLKLFGPVGLKAYLQTLQETQSLWLRFPVELTEIESAGRILETPDYEIFTAPLKHVIPCWGFRFSEKPRPGHFDEAKAEALGIPAGPLRGDLVQGRSIQLPGGRRIQPEEVVGPRRPGRQFAYCLDTQPCETVIELAAGVDCLVHEATFGQDLQSEATRWGHSTAADAARMAQEAGAKNLVLTHLSSRYMRTEVLLEEAQSSFQNSHIAEDLWSLDLKIT